MDFPETVKNIRKESHLSQQAFAQALGVSFATVNRWENGQQAPSRLALQVLKDYCTKRGYQTDFSLDV